MDLPRPVSLGLGLIGIGRPWGHLRGGAPPEREVMALLEAAVALGNENYAQHYQAAADAEQARIDELLKK